MPSARVDIISIGTLSRNLLWNESQPCRTSHSTTALIRTEKRTILVDPGLPASVIGARVFERVGLLPEKIDTVFLTNFRAAHRAGLSLFSSARRLIHEPEKEFARVSLEAFLDGAPDDSPERAAIEAELRLLDSFKPAPDKLVDGVDLFPLPGYSPGTCGLLVTSPTTTLMIGGDAVPTRDHFVAGQVLPETHDVKRAHESMSEVYEIADLIVPGHDNVFQNPRTHGM